MDQRTTQEKWHGGKGSRRRPTDDEKFRANYDNIDWSDTEDLDIEDNDEAES